MDVFLQRLWNPRSDPWKLVSLPKNHGLFRIKKKLHFSEFLLFLHATKRDAQGNELAVTCHS